ncbi:MAG TPA: DUF6491 family protein [Allosphingosinicella sp.]|jgi:hypothetical protein|nr:DUF6491 family protein [Allosphingosinicella sp.]
MKKLAFPLLALFATAPALALAAPPPADREVRIPFVQFGAIRSFRADGDRIVYLQGRRHVWYRAELNGPCLNLPFALRIGLDQRYSSTLDNSSSLLVEGERCRIMSLVQADPPPRRGRR